jgi:hypothetical protein
VQSTTRYPTPVINCVGDFSSLREAGLKGGKGLLGVTRRKSRDLRFSSGLESRGTIPASAGIILGNGNTSSSQSATIAVILPLDAIEYFIRRIGKRKWASQSQLLKED